MKKRILPVVILFKLAMFTTGCPLTESSPASSSSVGLQSSDWDILYTGFGTVNFENGILTLSPQSPQSESETHAALVLTQSTKNCPLRDFQLSVRVITVTQLRQPVANPWEVFWIFFNYVPQDNNTKTANYFILKPNGIELGKAFGDVRQTFLHTATNPQLTLGTEMLYTLEKNGSELKISINNTPILTYNNISTEEKTLYDQAGSIGLYTEDALVKITQAELKPLGRNLEQGSCSQIKYLQ